MSTLPRHQRVVIALSVHILRAGVAKCSETTVDGIEVRLALRCLLPHCPERWPLELYWDAASQTNEIGRAHMRIVCACGRTVNLPGGFSNASKAMAR